MNHSYKILRGFLMTKEKWKHGMTNKQVLDKVAKILEEEYKIIVNGPPED